MKYFYILLTMCLISSCVVTEDAKSKDMSVDKNKWHVISCSTGYDDDNTNKLLFFAIKKENGKEDMLFFAAKCGVYPNMILARSSIFLELSAVKKNDDLRIFSKKENLPNLPVVIWSGEINDSLLYEGIIINLGNVIPEDMIRTHQVYISNIGAMLK